MLNEDKSRKGDFPRREFLRLTTAAAAGMMVSLPVLAQAKRFAAFVPLQKAIPLNLRESGERAVFQGADLRFIGMPVGGICAGQVYLGGDGRLWLWDIFNEIKFGTVNKQSLFRGETLHAGSGANYVDPPEQIHPFDQGFALRVGSEPPRTMDAKGWEDVSFVGEYPMGFVEYKDPACPLTVSLEAFSPFIPLDADESGLPAIVMRFRVKNQTQSSVKAEIGGWMENPIGLRTIEPGLAIRRNKIGPARLTFTMEDPPQDRKARPPVVFEDWGKGTFEGWTVTGDAFGPAPVKKEQLADVVGNVGGPGKYVVKSYRLEPGDTNVQGDARLGRLTSREFSIDRHFLEFYIGGGDYANKTCLNLVVDGKVVRTAAGRREDSLRLDRFKVDEFEGKKAHIEIVDDEAGLWGQIGVGQISLVDIPSTTIHEGADVGDMTLALLDPLPTDRGVAWDERASLFDERSLTGYLTSPTPGRPKAGVIRHIDLEPGKETTVTFVIAWRFPNLTLNRLGKVGRHYAERFASSSAVVDHIQQNQASLFGKTKLWHETWYDSTLPRWFLDRTMAPTTTLATMTCARFANGRFYGWEGIGCCDGTCGHVWQYAQAVGRLFPSLERSVREMVDYGVAFHKDGLIDFRGEYGNGFAVDSQAGYILRTLREHQTSTDDGFLKRVYPRMKQALEYLIGQDADGNGILEGTQHNTLDVNLYGPSSWLTSLYLAALRAGEEMAKEMGDKPFADRCRTIFTKGSGQFTKLFWNGSYFIQVLKKDEHLDGMRIGDGCEADQIMGQGWAMQIGLGRIVDAKRSKAALKALYKNNFLTDIGPFREQVKPGRWYAVPGEAGLLVCSFPLDDRKEVLGPTPTWASMYFNEVWTGCEYEVAGHMIAEGLVDEGLSIVRAVYDRHHPSKRNPWNEVECSDHYARGMASYGVFVAACGFEYHGPKGHIGFAPKIRPEDFRSAFTAAEGWGTYRQRIAKDRMEVGILIRHGSLRLKTIGLDAPKFLTKANVTVGGRLVPATLKRDGDRLTLHLESLVRIRTDQEFVIALT